MTNPSSFIPRQSGDFIGQARKLAVILERKAASIKAQPQAVKMLVIGPPGTGKTAAVEMYARLVAGSPCQIEIYSGADLTAAIVRQWEAERHYRPLFGGQSVKVVHELDKASAQAQILLLNYLDKLPPWISVVATSNLDLSELSDRFQTRFQQFKLRPPSNAEIAGLLEQFGLNGQAQLVADKCGGNVRAALLDAQSLLDAREMECVA